MKVYDIFEEIATAATWKNARAFADAIINHDETVNHIKAINAQTEAAPLNVDAIAAIVAPYPEAFHVIRRDADKIDIYHDKDTAQYFKHVFAAINTILFANSVQRGAIDGGGYFILESSAIVRVYVDGGALPRFA